MRLDKFLTESNIGTRKEIKHFAVKGLISVNGQTIKDVSTKVEPGDCVMFNNQVVQGKRTIIAVLNKPAGYVTSTDDPLSPTVMALVPKEYLDQDIVPVGRLDKDTEGVLLFTNDGQLLHRLISPKNSIEKTYFAQFEGQCPSDAEKRFLEGIELKDGTICKPAKFEKISDNEFRLTITEGMYHQVKRMAAAMGMHITYLKRESFNNINCCNLKLGEFKEITL